MQGLTQNKVNPFKLFFRDLENYTATVTDGNPSQADIIQLVEQLKLGGISEDSIRDIYYRCGFNDWDEYLDAKRRDRFDLNVRCVKTNLDQH